MKETLFSNLAEGKIYEFCTESGSYIGKFVTMDDNNIVFSDVVKTVIAMMPVQVNEGGQQELRPVPKMEIINFYTTGQEFVFNKDDIVYIDEMNLQAFVQAYNGVVEMYGQMKLQNGSNITIPTVEDVNNIKMNK